jgi:hypothetical protein
MTWRNGGIRQRQRVRIVATDGHFRLCERNRGTRQRTADGLEPRRHATLYTSGRDTKRLRLAAEWRGLSERRDAIFLDSVRVPRPRRGHAAHRENNRKIESFLVSVR